MKELECKRITLKINLKKGESSTKQLSHAPSLISYNNYNHTLPPLKNLVVGDELGPGAPIREERVEGEGLGPGREALVEPQVVPPSHGHL